MIQQKAYADVGTTLTQATPNTADAASEGELVTEKVSIVTSEVGGDAAEWENCVSQRLHEVESQNRSCGDSVDFPALISHLMSYLKETLPAISILPNISFLDSQRSFTGAEGIRCVWRVGDETLELHTVGDGHITFLYECGEGEEILFLTGNATAEESKLFFTTQIADMTGKILGLFT